MSSEQVKETPKSPEGDLATQKVKTDWKALVEKLSYKGIVKNVPFLVFICFLLILYINNTQSAVEMQGELNKQNKLLKELRWKYMDAKTGLMYAKMETEIMKNAMKLGLKPLMLPAYAVNIDSNGSMAQ
jgi:hypothetical protein